VAEVFGIKPVPEEEATEKKIYEALQTSRYVHLSTHGRHNVEAPAFQCLYLTPDDESDGRIYAHELLSLDLRGLEVLTLSACETALGRFDIGDNLRGLPASFLLAGVSTLVGTLWPVETNASECFFSAFYRELKGGVTRLDAFATAQKETRIAFPKYRDWGPFYLVGDWR
jgi:CHAT domain-containing protein